jgi:fatty-acyl-CoA synthase
MQPPFSRTAFELLSEQASRSPEALAAISGASQVTYSALAEQASCVAARLQADGIKRGDRVGLLCSNRIEWLQVFFGASALGATMVPFSTWSTPSELEYVLRDSGVRCLFTLAGHGNQDFAGAVAATFDAGKCPGLERVIAIDGTADARWELLTRYLDGASLPTIAPGAGASAADPLVILYTSGSSSRPKAVPLDHFGIIENGFNIGERQGLRPGDRVLVSVPLFWSYGAANALPAALTHGATLVLQGRFEPGEALDLIERHQCTAIYTLPAMTNALLAHPQFEPRRTASLRTGVTIGSPQDVIKAAEELGAAEICNIYGSTETYGNCCVTPHYWPLEKRAACQGPPLPGVTLRIRDLESGTACPPEKPGLVEVRGYLTRGYAGDSARHNAEVFTTDGYFKTGDLGFLTDDGVFVYAGRDSEMIKRSGINVSPAEVEEVLQQHPHVGLAGVTGAAHPVKGEIIVAFVVPKPGAAVQVDMLLGHCRTKLSSYKSPDQVRLCESLPLTPTGKLMRRDLRALATQLGKEG